MTRILRICTDVVYQSVTIRLIRVICVPIIVKFKPFILETFQFRLQNKKPPPPKAMMVCIFNNREYLSEQYWDYCKMILPLY